MLSSNESNKKSNDKRDLTLVAKSNSTKEGKRYKKSEDPVLIAAKKEHDKLLAKLKNKENYIGVEVYKNTLKPNQVRGYKNGVLGGRIVIKTVDGQLLLLTEAACVNDFSNYILFMFQWLKTKEEKYSKLQWLLKNTPSFVSFEDTSIPRPILKYSKSTRENDEPFNFMNPSEANSAWKKEIRKRCLIDVGEEFTHLRKKAIFHEVVKSFLVRLEKIRNE